MQYKYGRYGIENLMLYITITMLAVFLAQMLLQIAIIDFLSFNSAYILQGQVWRVITFIFVPVVGTHPIFILLMLYVYYFLGNSLEGEWGKFSFTLYYLIGIICAVIGGFIVGTTSNQYLNLSLLLAFAQLFPNMEFRLFFLIPVKVKYIGYVMWILYALALVYALVNLDLPLLAALLAALLNFFLFFGQDIIGRFSNWMKYRGRRRQFRQNKRRYPNQW